VSLVKSELSVLARVHEIDRQLYSLRFMAGAMKWLVFPALALITVLLLFVLHDREVGLTAILSGASGLAAGGVGIFTGYRAARDKFFELRRERAELVSAGSDADKGQVAPMQETSRSRCQPECEVRADHDRR